MPKSGPATVCPVDRTPWGPLSLPNAGTFPAEGVCHLWPAPTTDADRYLALLSQAELERAERFKVAHARDTFITSRAAQRLILSRYLGHRPSDLAIARDCAYCGAHHGRPYVASAPIDFSVSHTKDWLLVAVVGAGKVGVDLEAVTDRAVEDLTDRVFTPAEQHQFLLVDRPERVAHFMRIWTRKEAAVKLTGHGLAAPLSDLDVTGPTVTASPAPANWPPHPIYLTDVPLVTDPGGTPPLRAALASTTPIRAIHLCGPIPSNSTPEDPRECS